MIFIKNLSLFFFSLCVNFLGTISASSDYLEDPNNRDSVNYGVFAESIPQRRQVSYFSCCTESRKMEDLTQIQSYISDKYINSSNNYPKVDTASAILGYCIGFLGVGALAVLSHDFFYSIGVNEYVSWVLASLSVIPPFLGFSSVSHKQVQNLLLFFVRDSNVNFSSVLKQVSIAIPSIITTLPLTFIAYDKFTPKIGYFSCAFAFFTTLSFYFYYHKTTSKLFDEVKNCVKCNNQIDNLGWIDHKIKAIKSSSEDDFLSIYRELPDNKYNEMRFLVGSFDSLDSVPHEIDEGVQKKWLKKENCIGATGAFIGLLGSYYFYPVAHTFYETIVLELNNNKDLATSLAISAGVLTIFCRGIFSLVSCFEVWKQIHSTKVSEICSKTGLAMIFFAIMGSIPSTEISLEYLGHSFLGYFFTVATTITVFSEGYWGLMLQKNRIKGSVSDYKENVCCWFKLFGDILKKKNMENRDRILRELRNEE